MAPPPRPPDGETARRRAASDPPSMRPSPARSLGRMMSAGRSPASGSARSPAAVKALPRLLRVRFGPAGDRRGRPCGNALTGQPEGWPSLTTNTRRCRGEPEPETASAATGSGLEPARSSRTPATADGTRRQEQRCSRSPGSTSRSTATGSARWRRKAARIGGPREQRPREWKCDPPGRLITPGQGQRLHASCRTGGVSSLGASTYTPSHSFTYTPVPNKSFHINSIPTPHTAPHVQKRYRGEVWERPAAKLAFCGPGRRSSVTPAGPVAPHRRCPSGKGCHGRGRRSPPSRRAPVR